MYTVHVLGIDVVWRENHVFANRADAERSVIGFEAEDSAPRSTAPPLGQLRTQMLKAIIASR
jgi:hypothetical protein